MTDAEPSPSGLAGPSAPSTSEIARAILARDAPPAGDRSAKANAAAIERSYVRVTNALRNAMGEAGCAALIARAVASAEAAHPILKDLRHQRPAGLHLEGFGESGGTRNVEAVSAALEAVIGAVVDILTRLIGEDMTMRLMEDDDRPTRPPGGARAP